MAPRTKIYPPPFKNGEAVRCRTDLQRLVERLSEEECISGAVVTLMAALTLRLHETSGESQELAYRLAEGIVGQVTPNEHDMIVHAFNDMPLAKQAEEWAAKLRNQ